MTRCWECEARAEDTVAVALPTMSPRCRRILLCRPCFRRYFLPLTAESAGASMPGRIDAPIPGGVDA